MIAAHRLPGLAVRSALCLARMRAHGMRTGRITCDGRQPILRGSGRVELGRVALRGLAVPVELGATRGGCLTIGDRVFVNQGATIVAALDITVGDDARIGDHVAIYDTDHHPVDEACAVRRGAVSIGRNAWIGRGAIVLPGVHVGDHAVVGAGAVVTQDVPARTIVAGNPARPVGTVTARDGWRRP